MRAQNAADLLRLQYERDLADLQAKCPHELGEPMPYMWAPGHFGGEFRWCIFCDQRFGLNGESLA